MIRRPPRSTPLYSSAASDVYKRQDEDRPTPPGQGPVVTRRPRPHPVLGRSATQGTTPADGQDQPPSAVYSARALSSLSGAPAARRPSATKPTRMGTVAGGHPQSGSQELPHHAEGRHAGRDQTPSHPRPMPTPTRRRWHWAQHFCLPVSPRCLLEPDAVKVASPVLRGAGRSNAPGLPDVAPPPRGRHTHTNLNNLAANSKGARRRSAHGVSGPSGLSQQRQNARRVRHHELLRELRPESLAHARQETFGQVREPGHPPVGLVPRSSRDIASEQDAGGVTVGDHPLQAVEDGRVGRLTVTGHAVVTQVGA